MGVPPANKFFRICNLWLFLAAMLFVGSQLAASCWDCIILKYFFQLSWRSEDRMTTDCKCRHSAPPTFLSAPFWRPATADLFFFSFFFGPVWAPHAQSHTSQLRRLISRSITELPGIRPDHTNAGKRGQWGYADLNGGGGMTWRLCDSKQNKKDIVNIDYKH